MGCTNSKQNKPFDYIPLLIARIIRARVDDNDLVARNVSLNKSDPHLVAPTVAAKPPLPPRKRWKEKVGLLCPPSMQNQHLVRIWGKCRQMNNFPQYLFHTINCVNIPCISIQKLSMPLCYHTKNTGKCSILIHVSEVQSTSTKQ